MSNKQIEFNEGKGFVGLAVKTSLLVIVTLGIYRFWQIAKLRRRYWSSTKMGGDSFEYSGTGLEKFLGFLIAVVILALYLGVVISIAYAITLAFGGAMALPIVQLISFVALLPLIYFAAYRRRRYILSRTRWRGIRMSLQNGAGRYTLMGIGYFLLTAITLGALMPLGDFRMNKFINENMEIGDQGVTQGGNWKELYKYYWLTLASIGLIIVSIVLISSGVSEGLGAFLILLGYVGVVLGFAYYAVRSAAFYVKNITLGADVKFDAQFRTRGVVGRYIGGVLLSYLVASGVILAVFFGVGGIAFILIGPTGFETLFTQGEPSAAFAASIIFLIVFAYFAMIVIMMVCAEIFIKMPIARYILQNMTVLNVEGLDAIKQGEGDDIADADGFADALDIGGGFI